MGWCIISILSISIHFISYKNYNREQVKKMEIISIHIMIGGKAEGESGVKELIKINRNKLQRIPKKEFLYKYSGLKTQGVVVYFKGKLYKEIHDLSKVSNDYSLLILDNIEDPQNFGQIIRTTECAGIDGIIIPEHNSPVNLFRYLCNAIFDSKLEILPDKAFHTHFREPYNFYDVTSDLKNMISITE